MALGSECVPHREMRMGSKFLKCCVSSEMALELWPSKSRAVTIILIAGAIVAVPIIYPPILQKFVDHFLYFPMRYPDGDWSIQAQAGAEDVWLRSEDGLKLNAWWF